MECNAHNASLYNEQGMEYETYWLSGRAMKFSDSSMNSPLPIRNSKLSSETTENGEQGDNPSLKNSLDKGHVIPYNENATKSAPHCRTLPRCEKKPIFSNEIRPIDTGSGTPKMVNGRTKSLHQRRRTKQRADILPEVMEVTIDVDDNFAEV
jgi:hypothetical protein